jgi:hypothetical protein
MFFINSQPWSATYDPVLFTYNFSRSEVSFNNFVASLKLVKTFPFADLGIAFSQSDLNGHDQSQVSLIAGTYPLYNLNLYTYTRLSAAAQHGEMQMHFKQIVGFRAAKHLWLQVGIHLGQLENVPDENSTLMYNVAGKVIYNAMASAIIIFNDHLRLLLDMNYLEQESSYITFYDLTSYSNNTYRFNNIQLKGGLLWKF